MKINNKGFAITSIIYSMLILFLTLVVLIIANLASRKVVFDQQKEDILDKFSSNIVSEEYQKIEYIKSTGTQYIDTGFKPTINTKVSTNLKFEEYQGYTLYNSRLFGATDYTNDTGFSINFGETKEEQNRLIIWTGKPYGNYKDQYDDSSNTNFPVNSIVVLEDTILNKNEMILTSDSFKYGTQTMDIVKTDATKWATNKVDKNMLILAATNRNDTPAITPFSIYKNVYLYDFKIYDNNVLVRNFVPCYRKSDNQAGLYDLVNDKFYTNSGEGVFLTGPDVE